ncbi:MAG: dTDP-4-amino-4,6-dideoxygalactose transaminase [Chitinophagaceae bacterium]
MPIPFNKPFLTGKECLYIQEAVASGKISGDGIFTKKCHDLFQEMYKFQKCLLTTSCTDALEMAAILANIKPGDEVIAPSYTFVSTINAFVLRGAKIVFADSLNDNPNLDPKAIEPLITNRTKAIIPVHYAGIACEMGEIMQLAKKYKLIVVEDAAQSIDSYYYNLPLGSIGDFGTFSFHETKNIISGEGGMLVINNPDYNTRAEIIREKGTNRSAFFRGEVDKYGWVDIGSSFLPSEIISAFLYAQLESVEEIQKKRKSLWNLYYQNLSVLQEKGILNLPNVPVYATNNAHMFYIITESLDVRTELIKYLRENGIQSVFHYLSLHKSPFYKDKHDGRELSNSDYFTDTLLRLPLFFDLTFEKVNYISKKILNFFKSNR